MGRIVIAGSGLAGYTLAREFRKHDSDSELVIITADNGESYSKPMLSNALAQGKMAADLPNRDADGMREQLDARILTRTRITGIDREARQLTLDNGETLDYGHLVLALGADPIRLPLKGDAADEVLSVNDLNDYARFREAIGESARVVVLGAGLIGCEFANDLRGAGYEVALVELADQPLARLAPPEIGEAIRRRLDALGVSWHLGNPAQAVDRDNEGYIVTLEDGTTLSGDVVLSAVGLRPRTYLAEEVGLACERGIVVDAQLTTSDPHIHAIGDCAEVAGQVLPYVMPLMNEARALAAVLAGESRELTYPVMPVVVKTPALPLTVCPPAEGVDGEWRVEGEGDDLEARFIDAEGRLRGFAVCGEANSRKLTLQKEVIPR